MRHEAGWAAVEGQVSASQNCRHGMSAPAHRPEDGESSSSSCQGLYDSKPVDGVSWWQSLPELSLGLVDEAGVRTAEPIIDFGAGGSTLVDHLVESGRRDLTAIDLSATALTTVRGGIADARKHVVLEVADVLDFHPGPRFGLWHDRAVFHFLTELDERDDYRASLERACNRPATSIATFGPERFDHLQRIARRALHAP
jgi:hypothetical protein